MEKHSHIILSSAKETESSSFLSIRFMGDYHLEKLLKILMFTRRC